MFPVILAAAVGISAGVGRASIISKVNPCTIRTGMGLRSQRNLALALTEC
ncbi:hypothetical protein [Arthrobacter sp. 260]|nr:hypothetical protein [Arthrobacter sp. 260]NOJ58371.1 hypothetical protein [Arthrobacter sp. 260]